MLLRPTAAQDLDLPRAILTVGGQFFSALVYDFEHKTHEIVRTLSGHLASCTDSIVLVYDFEHKTHEIVGNSN